MIWHLITYWTYVSQLHLFLPLTLLSAKRAVQTSSSLAPDFVLAIVHSASLLLLRGTVCRPTFELHQHSLLSKSDSLVSVVLFCNLTLLNLIRVAYAVRRPCNDFMDMLWRLINCRFIIIIIIIPFPKG